MQLGQRYLTTSYVLIEHTGGLLEVRGQLPLALGKAPAAAMSLLGPEPANSLLQV